MKNTLLQTIFFFFPFLLFAQNDVSHCNYNDSIFKLLPNEMTFNVEKYKVELMKWSENIIIDNVNYKIYFNGDSTGVYYIQVNKKLKINKTITYYPNGKIESFDVFYNPEEGSVIRVNKRFYYNVDGTIKQEENIDKGYKICYDEVIPLARKIIGERKIKKYELQFSLGRVDLNEFPEGKAKWYVVVRGNDNYHKKISPADTYNYVIDGVTGKLLGILKKSYVID